AGLNVDDQLVAHLGATDKRDVGDRRPADPFNETGADHAFRVMCRVPQLDHERLLGSTPGRTGIEDDGTTKLQHWGSDAIALREANEPARRRGPRGRRTLTTRRARRHRTRTPEGWLSRAHDRS